MATAPTPPPVTDRLARPVEDLRLSVTDRCNLRCRYCMPRELFGADHAFLEREELLSFEELEHVVGAFVDLGVSKLRITGGEPLLRQDLPVLLGRLAAMDGVDDVALTTNAVLLPRMAEQLAAAGVDRVTISLDALDDATFRAMADTPLSVAAVLEGIEAAKATGLTPIKINTVVQRGVNDDQIEQLAGWARDTGVTIRFIEFMDVGTTNGWLRDRVVPADEVLARIAARWPVDPIDGEVAHDAAHGGFAPQVTTADGGRAQVAERYRYRDGAGEVGVIASVTRPFCRTCVRARLSAIGELYTCLFASQGHDLRALVRDGASRGELADAIAAIWRGRSDRASELRAEGGLTGPRVEMSYIGG
ncbi:MAG: GTP 3',8-cyclase MoaA [Actinomycetota bacterium]